MRTEPADRSLRRAMRMMRAWRAIGLTGWLFFLASLLYISLSGRPHQARAIKVNDEIVLWVSDKATAERVLTRIRNDKGGTQFDARVVHETVPLPEGAKIMREGEAIAQLAQQIPVLVAGWKIVLEGEDVVTMDTKEHAEKVLEELKARYAALKEGEQILAQELKPEPALRETTVPPDELYTDVRGAAEMLQSSTPETLTHVVVPGDNPSIVAQKHNVRLADLVAQNPTLKQVIDGQRYLRPGEKLAVSKRRMGVKVITVKRHEEERTKDLEPLTTRTPDLPEGEKHTTREGTPQRDKVAITVTMVNDEVTSRKEDVLANLESGEPAKIRVGTGPRR
jgi:LysM repeat protein